MTTGRHIWLTVALTVMTMMEATGQYYTTGADPLRMRWSELEDSAGRWSILTDTTAWEWGLAADSVLSSKLSELRADFATTPLKRLKIVVHSRDAYSNGLVTWAPKRMETYSYDTGQDESEPWHVHLLTHEYRHSLQTQTVIRGFSKFLYGLFGEQSAGVLLGVFVPRWYLEGDAVAAETKLTLGGRGRNASFIQQMRVQVLDGRTPSYGQAYFGSYRRRVPDYYHMGYYTVGAVGEEYGMGVWTSALENTGMKPFTFVPFIRRLRQQTGMRLRGSYEWSMDKAAATWAREDSIRVATKTRTKEIATSSETDYEEITAMHAKGEDLIAYAKSPDYIGCFIKIKADGRREKIATPSVRNEEGFAVRGDTMVWSERRMHPRWSNASENALMLKDLKTGETRRLTREASYHSPAIRPDGEEIAAVVVGRDMRHRVVAMTWRGEEADTLVTERVGNQIAELTWVDSRHLAAIIVDGAGKRIVEIDRDSRKVETVVGPRHANIRHIVADGGEILFTADNMGGETEAPYNDMYKLTREGRLIRLTRSRSGVAWACPTRRGLVGSEYTARGYTPVEIDTTSSEEIGEERREEYKAEGAARQRDERIREKSLLGIHLVPNIHSWGPVIVDAEAETLSSGLSIASQNVLGTTTIQAGVNFGSEKSDERTFITATWDWLPVRLNIEAHWGHIDYKWSSSSTTELTAGGGGSYVFTEQSVDSRSHVSRVEGSALVPLTFNSGRWSRGVTPYVSVDHQHLTGLEYKIKQTVMHSGPWGMREGASTTTKVKGEDSRYACTTPGIRLYILDRMAERSVGHRLGGIVELTYDASPWHKNYGEMLTTSVTGYLPGIGRHHSISVSASMQHKWYGSYTTDGMRRCIADRVGAPFGLTRMSGTNTARLRGTYTLPICSPDWMLGAVTYIKRINMRGFYDHGITDGVHRWTAGLEAWADTRWLLLPYAVDLGIRAAWRPDSKDVYTEAILGITIN